jgi:hypothetical protein
MVLECKRYLTAMEEASDNIVTNSLTPDEEEDDTCHQDHIDRTKAIHGVAKIMSAMWWEDYVIKGLGEMLTTYQVDSNHCMVDKGPGRRSQFETYTASLRSLFQSSSSSYLMKILFPSYSLEEIQTNIEVILLHISEVLKYAESTSTTIEKYSTWIEHGAELATEYLNASLPPEYDEDGDELEVEEIEAPELYSDVRVKAYALLKLSDYSATRMASRLESIDSLIFALNCMVDLGHKLYANTDPKTFENIFNALVSKKIKSPSYKGTKFENIHELNEYLRQRVKDSVEEPHGFMYNISELLEETRTSYLDKLATEIIELLSFIPNKKEQKKFIEQFESGKIWQSENPGE